MEHCLDALQGSLRRCTLSAGTDQGSRYDPVWQKALVQHSLEELPCSQKQRSRFAGTDVRVGGEHVRPEASELQLLPHMQH